MASRSVVLVVLHARRAVCAFGVSLLVSAPAWAGTNVWTSFSGQVPGNPACAIGTGSSSRAAAAQCHRDALVALGINPAGICSYETDTYSDLGGGNHQVFSRVHRDTNGDQDCASGPNETASAQWAFSDSCPMEAPFDSGTGSCLAPPDCSAAEGLQADRFFADSGPGGAVCANPPGSESMECGALVANPSGVRACADGECFARLVFTGDQCGGEPDVSGELIADEPGTRNCVSGDGVTFCASQTSVNCGTVNGESICLDSVPPGRCVFLGDGGLVCGSMADGPTESDGMTPATPDGEFTASSDDVAEDDFRYFGPGTVAASGTPVSGTGDDAPSDEGDDECTAETCEGVLPELGETETFADATAAFMSAIEGAPIVSAAAGLGASMPAGECPAPSTEIEYLDGLTLVLDAHCGLWDEIAAVLTFVMLAVYVFLGARIILSA